eukprot:6191189-Pleurochrysis_carterae.AAC.7
MPDAYLELTAVMSIVTCAFVICDLCALIQFKIMNKASSYHRNSLPYSIRINIASSQSYTVHDIGYRVRVLPYRAIHTIIKF